MKYLIILIILIFSGNILIAQNKQDFEEITFFTKDSIEISGIYQYPSGSEKSVFPAIILIHQRWIIKAGMERITHNQ